MSKFYTVSVQEYFGTVFEDYNHHDNEYVVSADVVAKILRAVADELPVAGALPLGGA